MNGTDIQAKRFNVMVRQAILDGRRTISAYTNRIRLGCVLAVVLGLMFINPLTGRAGNVDHADQVYVFPHDVYINSQGVLVNPSDATATSEPLYNVAGTPLNLTWGQWKQAIATSDAHTTGGAKDLRTEIHIRLKGLVPNGVYSVFYVSFGPDSTSPQCPSIERSVPLTLFRLERNSPDPASFVADGKGRAEYHAQVDGDLLSATQLIFDVIYHYDGHTYYPLPNRGEFLTQGSACRSSFGEDDGRQLIIDQKF